MFYMCQDTSEGMELEDEVVEIRSQRKEGMLLYEVFTVVTIIVSNESY